jgi:Leucine Rich Repeat (LRR) protein
MRLAVAALLCCSVAVAAQDAPTPDERSAIDAVVKAGGKAAIDPKLAAEGRVAARFDELTDSGLIALKKHPQIGAIDAFDASKCTEKGYAALKSLPNLRRLVLSKSNLNPARAAAIGECKELRYLGLVEAGLTDAELASLKGLTRLEHLSLSNNKITDKGMQTVKEFERLRELYLANTGLTDKGLAELRGLDALRTLNLANTKVTAEAADKFVDEMPNLRGIRR